MTTYCLIEHFAIPPAYSSHILFSIVVKVSCLFVANSLCDGSLSFCLRHGCAIQAANSVQLDKTLHATDAPASIDLIILVLASIPRSVSSPLICCSFTDNWTQSYLSGDRFLRLLRTSSLNRCASSRFSCLENPSKFTVSLTSQSALPISAHKNIGLIIGLT